MPCTEKRARKLLGSGRARVHRLFPFAIRLTDRRLQDSALQPLRLSLDPGSKTTGFALARAETPVYADTGELGEPVMHLRFLMELVHRGARIRKLLHSRAASRRGRRSRNLRYRAPRFNNRTRPAGWLAPSLPHRVDTCSSWVGRLRRTGNFNIQTVGGVIQGISHRHCQVLQRQEGYGYAVALSQPTSTLQSQPKETRFLPTP